MARGIVLALVVVLILLVGLVLAAGYGTFGQTDGAGVIQGDARPSEVQRSIEQAVQQAGRGIGVASPKQVLFGFLRLQNLHVVLRR